MATPPTKKDRQTATRERIAAQQRKENRQRLINRSLIGIAILAVAGLLGYFVYQSQKTANLPNPQDKPSTNYASPKHADKKSITVGAETAPVTVDIYADYYCPHCKDFEEQTKSYIDDKIESGTVKVVFHPVSFLSGYSVLATNAAACAADQDAFLAYNNKLFATIGDDGLLNSELTSLGTDAGLNTESFKKCVDEGTYEDWALGVTQAARDNDIKGTPTVLVNGTALKGTGDGGALTLEDLQKAVEATSLGKP